MEDFLFVTELHTIFLYCHELCGEYFQVKFGHENFTIVQDINLRLQCSLRSEVFTCRMLSGPIRSMLSLALELTCKVQRTSYSATLRNV